MKKYNEILFVCFCISLGCSKHGFPNPTEPWESVRLNLDDAPMPVPQKDSDWVIRVGGESQETMTFRTSEHGFQDFETVEIAH